MPNIFKHDREDLVDLLGAMLNRLDLSERRNKAQLLLKAVEDSVGRYRSEKSSRFHHGDVRKSLLLLWKAADKGEDKSTLLGLLTTSAPGTLEYLTQRAERLWPSLGLAPLFQCALLDWAQKAPQEKLATMLIHCCAEGRQFVDGRKRPKDKQSKGKFEPVILCIAEGATGKNTKNVEMTYTDPAFKALPQSSKAGRSPIDPEVDLIMNLANDWYRITGLFEAGGRSDQSPLVEFITSVFRWASIKNAENALRVYWAEMKARKARSAPDILPSPIDEALPDTPAL